MRQILDAVPQLAGLKHSALSFDNVRLFPDMGLDCFIGNAFLMLPALTIGACGAIDGPLNVAPELWVDIWCAYQEGNMSRAAEAQKRASDFAALTSAYPFPSAYKALLGHRLGIDCGAGRPPNVPLTEQERDRLISLAEAHGVAAVAVGPLR